MTGITRRHGYDCNIFNLVIQFKCVYISTNISSSSGKELKPPLIVKFYSIANEKLNVFICNEYFDFIYIYIYMHIFIFKYVI